MKALLLRRLSAIFLTTMAILSGPLAHAQSLSGPSRPTGQYVGQVATRTFIPSGRSTNAFQIYSRTTHFARENLSSVQVVLPNFYVGAQNAPSDGSEIIQSQAGTATVSLEKADGTIIRATCGGSTTCNLTAGQPYVTTDPIPVSLAWGEMIRVRQWRSEPGGVLYMGPNIPYPGDQAAYGATTPDLTAGGTTTAAGTSVGITPAAIIGTTTRPSLCLSGDSGTHGYKDVQGPDATGDNGRVARSIGGQFAYINLGIGSDKASSAATKYANRLLLFSYCTHSIVQYGANDIINSATAASTQTNVQTLVGLIKPQVKTGIVDVTTLPPWSTSSDRFATTAGQTTFVQNSARVTYNNIVRGGGIAGSRFPLEIATPVETTKDSGIWQVGFTDDGLHELRAGALAQAMAGGINPARYSWHGR